MNETAKDAAQRSAADKAYARLEKDLTADRRREGSRNQRRFASGQSRHHEGRGGAWHEEVGTVQRIKAALAA